VCTLTCLNGWLDNASASAKAIETELQVFQGVRVSRATSVVLLRRARGEEEVEQRHDQCVRNIQEALETRFRRVGLGWVRCETVNGRREGDGIRNSERVRPVQLDLVDVRFDVGGVLTAAVKLQ
jgi:hypothetical protein